MSCNKPRLLGVVHPFVEIKRYHGATLLITGRRAEKRETKEKMRARERDNYIERERERYTAVLLQGAISTNSAFHRKYRTGIVGGGCTVREREK